MDLHRLAADVIERTVARASPAEVDAARRGARLVHARRLRAFARLRRREPSREGVPVRDARRRAAGELRAYALGRTGAAAACLATVDVIDRHLARVRCADGAYGHDRRVLRDALALHALRAVTAETGLHHASSGLPATFVRTLLSECGFEPGGAELVELLDRLADTTGHRVAARCAGNLLAAAPGLDPALADALVAHAVLEIGVVMSPASVRAIVRRERTAPALSLAAGDRGTADRDG